MIMPLADARKKEGPRKVQIVAHRGYWNSEEGQQAKNSIASLKSAQKHGFWGSEFDVNMTKDGVLLVWHDGSVSVNGEKLTIDQNNYDCFKDVRLVNGEKIPTVQEYLAQAQKSPKTVLVYELKTHSTPEIERACVDKSIEALKEYGYFDPSKTIFISFSLNICKYLTEKAPGFMIQYLDTDVTPDQAHSYGIPGMDTHYKTVINDKNWVKRAKSHGMTVNTWTVNKEEAMEGVLEAGVDQVTTDHPEVFRTLLKKKGIKEIKKGKK